MIRSLERVRAFLTGTSLILTGDSPITGWPGRPCLGGLRGRGRALGGPGRRPGAGAPPHPVEASPAPAPAPTPTRGGRRPWIWGRLEPLNHLLLSQSKHLPGRAFHEEVAAKAGRPGVICFRTIRRLGGDAPLRPQPLWTLHPGLPREGVLMQDLTALILAVAMAALALTVWVLVWRMKRP